MLSAAVIGCGHGGRLSLDALCASPEYDNVFAADASAEVRRRTRRDYPDVQTFNDLEQLTSAVQPDVVCIATPAPTHYPITRDVLEIGPRGLLLEKPIATNATDAMRLLETLVERQLPVVVPHGLLVLDLPQTIRQRIRNGDIGKIELVEVQNSVDLLNGGIHWIVYLLDLLPQDRVLTVLAAFDSGGRVVNDGMQVESEGVTTLITESGVRVVMYSGVDCHPRSDVLPASEQKGGIFRFFGSSGMIEFSAWADAYWIRSAEAECGDLVRTVSTSNASYHQIFLDNLARQIDTGKPEYTAPYLSVKALDIIDNAYRSHTFRRRISLGTDELMPAMDLQDWQIGIPFES